MSVRTLAAALFAIALLAPAPAAASPMRLLGAPAPGGAALLLLGSTSAPAGELDREAIYRILCGGETAPEPSLRAHLWKVAGSLASRSWVPPKVTIRVVVQPAR